MAIGFGVSFWCSFLVLCVVCQGALVFCVALFWRPPRCPKGVSGTPFGSSCGRPGVPRRGHLTVVICCFWGLSGTPWVARWDLARFLRFLLALSGHPLGRPRGPNNQSKVTATLRPVLNRVLRLRAGSRGSPRPRITTYRCAGSFSRDRCVFKTLVKYEGLEPFWHPRGPKH